MKKNLLLSVCIVMLSFAANAQFNLGIGGTYTNYGGEIKKATPGVQLRGAYNLDEKKAISLGFSYGLPIKQTFADDESGSGYKLTTSFMSVSVLGIYHLIGGYEDNFSLYFPIGGSYVMGKNKLESEGEADPDFTLEPEDEKFSGLTINGSVGMQFKIGSPFIFAEAGFALPTGSTTSNTRDGVTSDNSNPITGHTILTLGIRFPFGSSY
ncbi:outer membrane beta-barrel protein [Paradesertivirga mongoliensis]|uniref:Outer membrane beta-barrel protein n=1 Tax=Paradesertivirga mongoliensis TaxID=2100740 RepID=A0ABW4ZHM8_9SPHI|nr:outer membrane beta-barrel protein [Pedobacter mongoliensis]